jgi:hypothetical protein
MKKITLLLLFVSLVVLLSACYLFSGPNCKSGTEGRSGNLATGRKQADVTTATLCTDRTDYSKSDTVHITFTVKNLLDEQIVLGGGQQPVMDICVGAAPCLSHYQPEIAHFTRLVLEPGQSHTIQWDWPTPGIDMDKSVPPFTSATSVAGNHIRLDKRLGTVNVQFFYGPRRDVP